MYRQNSYQWVKLTEKCKDLKEICNINTYSHTVLRSAYWESLFGNTSYTNSSMSVVVIVSTAEGWLNSPLSCSNIRMQIISFTSIRLYVNAITYIAMPLFTKHTFFLWIFALFIMDSSQWDKWDKLSVVFIFHLSVCPILEQVFLCYIHVVKSVQDISIFWKILLFTPLEVVTTMYLQLSEDIAFLYKLEMP